MNQPLDDDLDLTIAARVLGLVDRLPHLVGVTDDQGQVLWLNAAGRNFVGVHPGQSLTTGEVFTDQVFDRYYAEIRPAVLRGEPWTGNLRVRRADGTLATVEAVIIGEVGPGNEVLWLSTLAVDVTEQREREARLSHLASHDSLTGLPNRVLLVDRLSVAMSVAERTGGEVAILALDLDGFKEVNDRHGHHVGDRLLQQVTARLEATVRPTDTVARMGGDEFVVIIHPPEGPEAAALVAERVRAQLVSPPYVIGTVQVSVTASIGLTMVVPGDSELDELLAAADRGMYRAKRSGGNCVRRSDPKGDAGPGGTLDEVGRGLARALAAGSIVPVFEPVVDLSSGDTSALDIEVRWDHPSKGRLTTEEFFEAALLTGYADLVWWAAIRAALQVVEATGIELPVCIELGVHQLRGEDLPERLAALRRLAPTADLCVRASADSLLEGAAAGIDVAACLEADDLKLVLTAHGRTNVPRALLVELPVGAVQLDHALTDAVRDEPMAVALAAQLPTSLGVPCVATGVRDPADLPLLAVLGVTAVRGPVNGAEWDLSDVGAEAAT